MVLKWRYNMIAKTAIFHYLYNDNTIKTNKL